ncbi:MAG TPA: Asp-tRNA(Asn)/Glu-tRNA(Gln) amidotransferase subunit GatB [Candidatus Kaiserbacteria bacterium]|nr:Asp-tRNA(Asn)/Glu-tRNA(Gln) amidotransferase subunit GatB [Candidatus Kaiserbacteria bacterium]
MDYIPTIGLEVHAELDTNTKMFCGCKNDPDETKPNTNICPVCMAHPGTLPTINKMAVKHVMRIGRAIGGDASMKYSEFDRKSYFYPDIPKGYQISQYEYPFISNGELSGVKITRIHLEEDTARSSHSDGESLVDFNRAGVPLMELVTEPVIHDAITAGRFARELQRLLRTLGASNANLEKGEMRIEANVSVSKDKTLGTKVEIKNLNSFRSVERAIDFEIKRQIKVIEKGENLEQETRGWEERTQKTFRQRSKEGSADYRYFPEPDLPKMSLSEMKEFSPEVLDVELPELPWERRNRYKKDYQIKDDAIEYLIDSEAKATFFDAVASELEHNKKLVERATNYIVSDLAGWYAKNGGESYEHINPVHFAELIRMTVSGDVSSRGAKDILVHMVENGGDPKEIADKHGLLQERNEDALVLVVDTVLRANSDVADEYRSGKENALQYLIGQSMKESRGSGNPELLRKILIERIGNDSNI